MRFLLLNQTFHPDVAATAQYLTELALELIARGHHVTVLTSRRAYDEPEKSFPRRETWRGIHIIRIGCTGFGKAAKWRRAADFASFLAFCAWQLALLPRHDVVVALTSPPLISFLGALAARLRGAVFYYWVMDFNPDEAVAAGWLGAGSLPARVLEALSRFSLKQATRIFALDHFMRDRIAEKGVDMRKIAVLSLWSHGAVEFHALGRDRFRQAHGLEDKFVVMYSGNHSPVHPLDTILAAADQLRSDPSIVFCFVGGGSQWREIQNRCGRRQVASAAPRASRPLQLPPCLPYLRPEASDPNSQPWTNLLCLPYQPFSELSGSLSAADLHVVVMGDALVGLVHPCKIYNILNVGAPVLYVGPRPSHVTELLASLNGTCVARELAHGDVDGVVRAIRELRHAAEDLPKAVREVSVEKDARLKSKHRLESQVISARCGSAGSELNVSPNVPVPNPFLDRRKGSSEVSKPPFSAAPHPSSFPGISTRQPGRVSAFSKQVVLPQLIALLEKVPQPAAPQSQQNP